MQRRKGHHREAGGDQNRAADSDEAVNAEPLRQAVGQKAADEKAHRRERSVVAIILRRYAEAHDQYCGRAGSKDVKSCMGARGRKCVRHKTPGLEQTAIAAQHRSGEHGRGFGSRLVTRICNRHVSEDETEGGGGE